MFIKARSITASQTGRIYDSNLLLHQNQCLANGDETIYGLAASFTSSVIRQRCLRNNVSVQQSLSDYGVRQGSHLIRPTWLAALKVGCSGLSRQSQPLTRDTYPAQYQVFNQ